MKKKRTKRMTKKRKKVQEQKRIMTMMMKAKGTERKDHQTNHQHRGRQEARLRCCSVEQWVLVIMRVAAMMRGSMIKQKMKIYEKQKMRATHLKKETMRRKRRFQSWRRERQEALMLWKKRLTKRRRRRKT